MTTDEMIKDLYDMFVACPADKDHADRIATKLRAADELARAAYNMSNAELDPEETHYELNKACAAYYDAGKGGGE